MNLDINSHGSGFFLKAFLPALCTIAISVGTVIASNHAMTVRMEERIAAIGEQIAAIDKKHERDALPLLASAKDHEQRIARLEALTSTMQATLNEVRKDIKDLLYAARVKR